jgi:hypothetical protein
MPVITDQESGDRPGARAARTVHIERNEALKPGVQNRGRGVDEALTKASMPKLGFLVIQQNVDHCLFA